MNRLRHIQSKIITLDEAARKAEMARLKNKKVVFTNGCFDLLHLGHVTYLAQAASLGDLLIVAINDDASVRGLNKGADRPINPEQARAMVLAALGVVDYIVVFCEPTPLNAIEAIKPTSIVKGGDYSAEENNPDNKQYIVGKKEAAAWGGTVQTIPLVDGYSTTSLLAKR